MTDRERESVPTRVRPYFDAISSLTDAVCREHLTGEYAALCRQLAAALCRKRPSPVTRGRIDSWACGVAYAIGSVNFLFDRSQTPHLMASELCALFGVSPSTGAAKAEQGPEQVELVDPREVDERAGVGDGPHAAPRRRSASASPLRSCS